MDAQFINVAAVIDNKCYVIATKEGSKEILVVRLSCLEFRLHKIYVPILPYPILLGEKVPLRHLLDM